jgi:hypothetical protein
MLGHLVSNNLAAPAPRPTVQLHTPQQQGWLGRLIAQLLHRR